MSRPELTTSEVLRQVKITSGKTLSRRGLYDLKKRGIIKSCGKSDNDELLFSYEEAMKLCDYLAAITLDTVVTVLKDEYGIETNYQMLLKMAHKLPTLPNARPYRVALGDMPKVAQIVRKRVTRPTAYIAKSVMNTLAVDCRSNQSEIARRSGMSSRTVRKLLKDPSKMTWAQYDKLSELSHYIIKNGDGKQISIIIVKSYCTTNQWYEEKIAYQCRRHDTGKIYWSDEINESTVTYDNYSEAERELEKLEDTPKIQYRIRILTYSKPAVRHARDK